MLRTLLVASPGGCCLLMDRRYPPYGKWLGSAFALTPVLTATLAATDGRTREHHLAHAYEIVAAMQNPSPPRHARTTPGRSGFCAPNASPGP
ncbi:hypothetical protein PFZ55_21380 [Streptomyces sp. MS2A]|nr:hypothetical protein [Streptomyces sp. MS2A]